MNSLIDTPKYRNLIYDIGMHKGEDTEFYLRKGFKVVAFEANPSLIRICKTRLKEFIEQGNLVIVEGAIVDFETINNDQKKISFYNNNDLSVWGTVSADWAERNSRLGTSNTLIEVDVINLEDVIRKQGIPHFMKIDIEGCDMVCVKVLKKFLNCPDYISVESDKTSFKNIKYEIELLSELGYEWFQAIEQSAIHKFQSPPFPSREGEYVAHKFEEGASGLFGAELNNAWKSKHKILQQYRAIRLGYYLLGDDGIMKHWKFPGAGQLRVKTSNFLAKFTKANVPGWYDTHARHSKADI